MDFALTEEQEELQKVARRLARGKMVPAAAHYDRTCEYPAEIVAEAHRLGLMTLVISAEYGGRGMGCLEVCIVAEELATGCMGMTTIILSTALALTPLILYGTEGQKQKFLMPFTQEPYLGAFCLTERQAGSDAAAVSTRAELVGDEYVLNGAKCFITNGSRARLYTVIASTDPSRGARGLSAFLVPGETPGLRIGKVEDKMGQRASDTAEVLLEDVHIPRENLLGQQGRGFIVAMQTLDRARPGVAAAAVGLARAAMEAAIVYSQGRQQFGQSISSFQAIQFMIADMAIKIEAARLLAWQAAWLADQGIRNTTEAAIAKCYATDVAMEVTTDAVQVLGGYGYIKDYPVEKYMRDAKIMQIYEGTNQIQRAIVARALYRQ